MSHVRKFIFILFGFVATLLSASACSSASFQQQSSPRVESLNVHPIGGATREVSETISLEWPGSGVRFIARGSSVSLRFNNAGHNRVRIDIEGRSEIIDLAEGVSRIEVAVPDGVGEVQVRRLNDLRAGALALEAITPIDKIVAQAPQKNGILLLGDSISVGYGVDGSDQTCRFSFDTENHSLTFGALTADAFDAELTTIAVSGRGLVRNWANSATPTIPDLWTAWSASVNLPSNLAIIVNLGTNDFNGYRPGAAFVDAYVKLIVDLKRAYPNAPIYLATGPMLSPEDLVALESAVDAARAKARLDEGIDTGRLFFALSSGGHVFGCDWHPGRDTHRGMAQILIERLEADLGWRVANAS